MSSTPSHVTLSKLVSCFDGCLEPNMLTSSMNKFKMSTTNEYVLWNCHDTCESATICICNQLTCKQCNYANNHFWYELWTVYKIFRVWKAIKLMKCNSNRSPWNWLTHAILVHCSMNMANVWRKDDPISNRRLDLIKTNLTVVIAANIPTNAINSPVHILPENGSVGSSHPLSILKGFSCSYNFDIMKNFPMTFLTQALDKRMWFHFGL